MGLIVTNWMKLSPKPIPTAIKFYVEMEVPTSIRSRKLIVFCPLEEISTVLMKGHFILFYVSYLGMVNCIFDGHKH